MTSTQKKLEFFSRTPSIPILYLIQIYAKLAKNHTLLAKKNQFFSFVEGMCASNFSSTASVIFSKLGKCQKEKYVTMTKMEEKA